MNRASSTSTSCVSDVPGRRIGMDVPERRTRSQTDPARGRAFAAIRRHEVQVGADWAPMAPPRAQDHYAVLGVAKTASAAEIQAAYKRLAKELHPDVNRSPRADEDFRKVVEAYQ